MEIQFGRLFDSISPSAFGPPQCPGVYAVCVKNCLSSKERIIYIGSAQNIFKRVMKLQHPYRLAFSRFNDKYVYTKSIETEDYARLEKELIKIYRPLLNKAHKNNG